MTDTSDTKKKMIEALEKNLGIVSIATQNVGIHRSTHYDWMKNDSDYKKAVDDIHNVCLDFAESKLFEQIQDNNTSATIFYLKTKGRKRGYWEKQQMDMTTDDEAIQINIS